MDRFREPIGKYPVGIRQYDTGETGDTLHRRRVSFILWYPDIEGDLPVIIFNHGLGGFATESSVLCLDLASSGYLLVSIAHPYGGGKVTYTDGSTFEDPEPIDTLRYKLDTVEPLWYEDILETISFLKKLNAEDPVFGKRLMLNNIGVGGVSFGGCCSVTAALRNNELTYAVNIDGSMFVEPDYRYPDKPVFVMCSPNNSKAYAGLVRQGCSNVKVQKVRKVSHFEFSDGIYLSERGRNDRERADRISIKRAEDILDFIRSV